MLFGTRAARVIHYARIVIMFWIVMGVAVMVVLAKRGLWRSADLGFASDRWVTEHRLAETSDHG